MTPTQIRALRDALQMTQSEFAARLGLQTKGAVSHLEAGRKVPTGSTLAALRMLVELTEKNSEKKRKRG